MGASLAYAAKLFGLEAAVYQVKISYEQKPYRRSIMQTYGAQVTPSPSMSTRAGKDILTAHPNHQGSWVPPSLKPSNWLKLLQTVNIH